jgi:hypothetical protein
LHQLLACDALISVLFRISFVQQRPVPCTGLHCTPPRKAREIKDPQVLCPLHRVLCLCVLLCVSVSLCAVSLCAVSLCSVRSVGPLNRTSLHSPTQGAGGRETLVFNFSRVSPQCVIARSRPSTRVQDATQCIVSRMVSLFSFINSCSGCNPVHRVQDGQFVLVHQLVAEHVGWTSLFSFKVVVFRMQPSASCPGWYSTPRFTTNHYINLHS